MTDGEELSAQDGQSDKKARIERELATIEQSAAFVRSPVMKRLLRFIVAESLAGRGGQIKSYTLAVDGLGRSEDFDAQQDSYPRVQIGRLRKALDNYYLHNKPADGLMLDLRPGGYQIHFVETGGSNAARTSRTFRERATRWPNAFRGARGRIGAAIFMLLCASILTLLVAGGMIAPWGTREGAYETDELKDFPLIAFQPIVGNTQEGVDANLADWLNVRITDAMLASRWVRLKSAQASGAANAERPDYELHNRIYREKGQIFIALEVIESRSGQMVWARAMPLMMDRSGQVANMEGILTRLVSSVFDSGGVIAKRVVQGDKGQRFRPGYPCLVHAGEFWFQRRAGDYAMVKSCLERTLAMNPRSASAWSWTALLEQADHDFNYSGQAAGNASKAWDAAYTAVALDPSDGFARSVVAYVLYRAGDFHPAHAAAMKSLELNPYSSVLLLRSGNILFFTGDRRGLEFTERARIFDPNPGPWFGQALFFDAVAAGRTRDAASLAASMPEVVGPTRPYLYAIRSIVFAMEGKPAEARRSWKLVAQWVPPAAADPQYLFDRVGVSKPYGDRAIALLRSAGAVK